MTLTQIVELCREHPIPALILVIIGSTVTVRRLELPIYKWARDWINRRLEGLGQRLTASLAAKIETQSTELAALRTEVGQLRQTQQTHAVIADRRRADDYRRDILRFNREIMEGAYPDRESYVEILAVIDRYVGYCRDHPDYPNSRATAAIENITQHYQHCLVGGFNKEVIHGQNH